MELDYIYPIDNWLQGYEVELENAGKREERIVFCQKMLEIFNWEGGGGDDSCLRCGIGEAIFGEGRVEETYEYFESWLKDEPRNVEGINSFYWVLYENGDREKAYTMVRKMTWSIACGSNNAILFHM